MREKLLVNDIHLGATRVSGTTQASQMVIREYLLASFERLAFEHLDKDMIVNGDLFDAFWVSPLDALGFYDVARRWLKASVISAQGIKVGGKMWVGRGNHDWSKDSMKMSSFDMICRILSAEFPDRFVPVTEPDWLTTGIRMIPHMANQELFDLALEQTPQPIGRAPLLLLHANYDNGYTADSDHSLNVSAEQAGKLMANGWTLVFGHEHQARRIARSYCVRTNTHDWGVIVTGNQWPSSVADCLNNPDNVKHAHIIKADRTLVPILTWQADDDFAQLDWRDLASYEGGARFIRVTGKASSEEASDAIAAISQFRRDRAEVLVVTNAVVVEGVADMGELKATAENIKAFDVLGFLIDQLDEKQAAKVRELIARDENNGRQLEAA